MDHADPCRDRVKGRMKLDLLAIDHDLAFIASGFPDHVGADEPQQHKGDPVVHGGDLLRELGA